MKIWLIAFKTATLTSCAWPEIKFLNTKFWYFKYQIPNRIYSDPSEEYLPIWNSIDKTVFKDCYFLFYENFNVNSTHWVRFWQLFCKWNNFLVLFAFENSVLRIEQIWFLTLKIDLECLIFPPYSSILVCSFIRKFRVRVSEILAQRVCPFFHKRVNTCKTRILKKLCIELLVFALFFSKPSCPVIEMRFMAD